MNQSRQGRQYGSPGRQSGEKKQQDPYEVPEARKKRLHDCQFGIFDFRLIENEQFRILNFEIDRKLKMQNAESRNFF